MKTAFVFLLAIPFSLLTNCNSTTANQKIDSAKKDRMLHSTNLKAVNLPTQVLFPSLDGLQISGDSYFQSDTLPWILLCHQAGYSRGEFRETAPKFEKLGYNCLAIDLRSGNEVNGIKNETASRAKEQGKSTDYLDAEQDIVAAINYLHEKNSKCRDRKIILVGSSYSAGLVLKIAVGNPLVKAVLAFSPGEYYGDKLHLAKSIVKIDCPVFITCAKSEVPATRKIFDAIENQNKLFFTPTSPGIHASSCLWESTNDYKEYWTAVDTFFGLL